jgi:ATP-binding cassette subfamily F protein uup
MAAPILALKDVRLADGPRPLFSGVDLALEPRVRACLVGRNGAGKSTLLRILAGQVTPDSGDRTVTPGTRIAYVPQEPPISAATVLEHATSGGAVDYMAESWLHTFGLDPAKSAQGLSGGEARRAALAKAFAEDPDVILLDEPTNHLDIFAIQTLESELASLKSAALIVSHDRAFLNRVTQRSFWLESRVVRRLDKGFEHFDAWAEQLAAADEEESRRLQKALAQDEYWLQRGVTARRARNEGRRRRLMGLREQVAERRREQPRELTLAIDAGQASGKLVVEAKGVSKAFGARTVLPPFSTRIIRGDRVALVGPNGAGKTTLVKLLLGELPSDSGTVKLGANLAVAYVDQARAPLTRSRRSGRSSPLTATRSSSRRPQARRRLRQGLPLHLRPAAPAVRTLSGGERNRLLLARALATPANLMVLDEPTNDLDMDTLDLWRTCSPTTKAR